MRSSPDFIALQLTDNILSSGQSSRMYRELVDGQLAATARSFTRASLDPSLFEISAQPRRGVPVEKLEQAIYTVLNDLMTQGPSEQELQKAKNQSVAAYYRSLQSIAGRAQAIGQQEVIFGDWRRMQTVEQRINAVTTADIQRVMKTYLQPNNRTVAILVPTAGDASQDGRRQRPAAASAPPPGGGN